MKVLLKTICSYGFQFFKLNHLRVIHDLYSQCLTQTLSKTTYFSYTEGVFILFCINLVNFDIVIEGVLFQTYMNLKSKYLTAWEDWRWLFIF